jgi:hypothetical protein
MPKVPVLAGRQSGLAGANLDLPAASGRWENSVGTPANRPILRNSACHELAMALDLAGGNRGSAGAEGTEPARCRLKSR